MKKKRGLITGITGQDGAYLAQFLLNKNYQVFGTYRRLSTPNFWRLQYLNIFEKVHLIPADLLDSASLIGAVKIAKPDEIYNLAAQSFVGASFEQPIATGEITGLGVVRMLEAIRMINKKIKFYQASTSELYGNKKFALQNEDTPFCPASPYASAKLYAYWITKIYRESYGIFACNGILFNHESPLRGLEFVTRKISNAVAKIALGLQKNIYLGNLEAKRDWGYAPEYVKSMWLMLQQSEPNDFVIATEESHSIKEFAQEAFNVVNLDWKKYVRVNKCLLRPLDIDILKGNCSKAKKYLKWRPKVKFKKLVNTMVKEDLRRWQLWLNGKKFAWDAPSYPAENKILARSIFLEKK